MPSYPNPSESELRLRLGIPAEASRVLVLAESSHWDPDWLMTSQEYYQRFVRNNLDAALAELQKEPRRIYLVECIFFLKRYWEEHPKQQETIRQLVNDRRLRMTSTGVTTPDTLLPRTELLMRDYLLGQEWLRQNGMDASPDTGYFPDSFGCAHALPSLLNAAGFHNTAITRVDGMNFIGCEVDFPWKFPRPGSTAERLLKQEKSLDFIWRDNSGGEVLCHWNAFTYGQGDMLAYSGLARVYLAPYYRENRSDRNVTAKIKAFTAKLAPLSRTPYLFCPIGFDFNAPIPDLLSLLDRYNQRHYPRTGIWVVNAGLDDYLVLIDGYRARLPVFEADPNPYWTGFYSSRPALKKLCFDLADHLVFAETLALQAGDAQALERLAPAWFNAVVSNHHDFITGTATDKVVNAEQEPWLRESLQISESVIAGLTTRSRRLSVPRQEGEAPQWRLADGLLEVDTPVLRLDLAEEAGGCIVRAVDKTSGQQVLGSPSNDLISYQDSGGLWRMGNEFPGGTYRIASRISQSPARLQARLVGGCLEVTCTALIDGLPVTRRLWVGCSLPGLHFQVEGVAAEGHTLAVRFKTGLEAQALVMDEPGGVVQRPVMRHYQPTYWPVHNFVQVENLAFLRGTPGGCAWLGDGSFELVSHRNAPQETAWGFLKFPGMPVKGHEASNSCLDYGVLFLPGGDWRENRLFQQRREVLQLGLEEPTLEQQWVALVKTAFHVQPETVQVLALKPAGQGSGVVLRIFAPGTAGEVIRITPLEKRVETAWLCDARERRLAPLEIQDGVILLSMPGAIATIWILGSERE